MDMPRSEQLLATSGELRMLIGQIRGYLSSTDQTGDETICDLWRRYVDASMQINQRLDLCSQLLERGEWIEAIRSAELEPNLFDCITALDFERRTEWEQLGCDLGWERLIPVSPAVSDRLQAAWNHRKRIQSLLKEHLRLSISRAPLSKRLTVMHQLAQKDHMSTFWREDIQRLERARGPQLQRELQEALRTQDAPQLQTLLAELRDTPWTLKLPNSLKSLEPRTETLVLDQILIPEAANLLIRVWNDRRDAEAPAALAQWNKHTSQLAGLGPPRPEAIRRLMDSTSAARAWAQKIVNSASAEGAWRTAVDQLRAVLQSGIPTLRVLQNHRRQVDSLFDQIPFPQRDITTMSALDEKYREVRFQRLISIGSTVAMFAAAILVPGVIVTLFVVWLFS